MGPRTRKRKANSGSKEKDDGDTLVHSDKRKDESQDSQNDTGNAQPLNKSRKIQSKEQRSNRRSDRTSDTVKPLQTSIASNDNSVNINGDTTNNDKCDKRNTKDEKSNINANNKPETDAEFDTTKGVVMKPVENVENKQKTSKVVNTSTLYDVADKKNECAGKANLVNELVLLPTTKVTQLLPVNGSKTCVIQALPDQSVADINNKLTDSDEKVKRCKEYETEDVNLLKSTESDMSQLDIVNNNKHCAETKACQDQDLKGQGGQHNEDKGMCNSYGGQDILHENVMVETGKTYFKSVEKEYKNDKTDCESHYEDEKGIKNENMRKDADSSIFADKEANDHVGKSIDNVDEPNTDIGVDISEDISATLDELIDTLIDKIVQPLEDTNRAQQEAESEVEAEGDTSVTDDSGKTDSRAKPVDTSIKVKSVEQVVKGTASNDKEEDAQNCNKHDTDNTMGNQHPFKGPQETGCTVTGEPSQSSDQYGDITNSQLADIDWNSQFPVESGQEEQTPKEITDEFSLKPESSNSATVQGPGVQITSVLSTRDVTKQLPQIEDGSAILAGIIKEVSQLNSLVLRTKREMELSRRQKPKTSN